MIRLPVGVLDAAFGQHASRADRFGVFGDERTLLGCGGTRAGHGYDCSDDEATCMHE
jgi:hypothetical protein